MYGQARVFVEERRMEGRLELSFAVVEGNGVTVDRREEGRPVAAAALDKRLNEAKIEDMEMGPAQKKRFTTRWLSA